MAHILIVDEDTDVLRLLHAKLSYVGYTVRQARNGSEALQRIAEQAPDSVITELAFPDYTGAALITELRMASPHSLLLVLSGQADDSDITTILAAGATDFLSKPFSPQSCWSACG